MARRKKSPPPLDLVHLLPSWELALRAERKSPATVKSYGDGVRKFIEWTGTADVPPVLDKPTVNRFVSELLDAGAEAATARSRHLALRRFSAWLVEEDEADEDLLLGSKPPKLDRKVINSLTEAQCAALLKACKGKDLRDRRDEAIVRLMLETGIRAGEVCDLTTDSVNLTSGTVTVVRGKGGKGRVVPISDQTGRTIDRYLRARRAHLRSGSRDLWVGDRGKTLAYYGLHKTLKWRADLAGIPNFTPHVLRHTAASRWLAAGGSEGGLMAVAGWSTRDMIDRYAADTASARAAEEARRLNLGDL
ncbi:tyrosine-type recombinase/integrase [Dietzia sp. SLG310A2-38A2]|uniref:tyrosine-type recombinase/integrase n=1 Tax=Dietzia sp. SLG310A2-38A2 TaxID=1630643 RepID=UPI0015FE18E1|nr:tyrosine-type recombinase/integrase [Dietzia sp. SLG310A2-38A2]MBB1032564.1 tyrosine-type recombinase/integrase [Dietzia sp. SLG310A2-38A2]